MAHHRRMGGCALFFNFGMAAYTALIPDQVKEEKRHDFRSARHVLTARDRRRDGIDDIVDGCLLGREMDAYRRDRHRGSDHQLVSHSRRKSGNYQRE